MYLSWLADSVGASRDHMASAHYNMYTLQ